MNENIYNHKIRIDSLPMVNGRGRDRIYLLLFLFLILPYTLNAQTGHQSKESVWSKKELRILDIGNSYTDNVVSLLPSLASKLHIDTKDICLYKMIYAGSTFQAWVNAYHAQNDLKYTFGKVLGALPPTTPIVNDTATPYDSLLLHNVLDKCQWDVIIIHQASLYAPYYEQYDALPELLSIIRKHQPNALIGTYLIHSYWSEYGGNNEHSSQDRWRLIAQATKQMCEDHGIDFIIPYGTAVENLRLTSYNKGYDFTKDGTHLAYGLVRYAASCCYFESTLSKRYGVSISNLNATYDISTDISKSQYAESCVNVTNENNTIAQRAALYACQNMYSLKNPEETTNGISSMTIEGRKSRKHMRGNRLLIEVGDAVYGIDGIKHRLQASQK